MIVHADYSTRQDRRKARTRERILDAAQQLFAVDGETVTLEHIAETADVAVATIYQHFSGKDDLHYAVIERAAELNERYMVAVYESVMDPVDKLIDAAGAYYRCYLESPQLFQLVQMPPEDSADMAAASMVAARITRMNRSFARAIEDGVRRGALREVPAVDTVHALWGAMNGLFGLAARADPLRLSNRQLRGALAQGLEILLEGVVTDDRRDPDGRLNHTLRQRIRTTIDSAERGLLEQGA